MHLVWLGELARETQKQRARAFEAKDGGWSAAIVPGVLAFSRSRSSAAALDRSSLCDETMPNDVGGEVLQYLQ